MTTFMQAKWPWIEGSHSMRKTLIEVLDDEDLNFKPGGRALCLGELCREIGEVERAYIESLKSRRTDFSGRGPEPLRTGGVTGLAAWYEELDRSMKATLESLSEEDFDAPVERAGGFTVPLQLQMDIYLQALLIFFGKISVYLKIMDRELPAQIIEYIG